MYASLGHTRENRYQEKKKKIYPGKSEGKERYQIEKFALR
jgi:hypothetical protein